MPVNPKQSIPKLIGGIKKKITQCEAFTTEYHSKVWNKFVESKAMELLQDLKGKQRNLEDRWQNEFESQLEEADWDKYSEDIELVGTATDKAHDIFVKWIHVKQSENAPTQQAAGGPVRESSTRLVDSFKPFILTREHTLEEFNQWRQNFRGYYQANQKILEKQGAEFQRSFLFNVIDVKFQTQLSTDDTVTNETVIMGDNNLLAKLKASFMEEHPLFKRRFDYHNYHQEKNQSFPDWWNLKKLKAQECDLEKVKKDDVVLMALICGVADDKLRAEFLKTKDPTVAQLVEIGNTWHTSARIQKEMKSSCNKTSDYKTGQKTNWQSQSSRSRSQSRGPSKPGPGKQLDNGTCYHCAGPFTGNCAEGRCKAKQWDCKNCGIIGHSQRACKKPKNNRATQQSSTTKANSGNAVNCRVTCDGVRKGASGATCSRIRAFDDNEDTPVANMTIITEDDDRFEFSIMPDTGSSQGLVAENIAIKHGMKVNPKRRRNIQVANGKSMHCSGTVDFGVEYEGQRTDVRALVSHDLNNEILLGWKALQRLSMISQEFPKPVTCRKTISMTTMESLMGEFADIFKVDGPLKTMKGGPMSIKMRDGPVKATFTSTARKCPYAFENLVKAKLDEDEALGIIEKVPIEEVTEWCSPAHFVMKPNGGVRSVVDLQGLNNYVQRPIHPFPTARDIVSNIPPGTKWFAVFDCKFGYWQIELDIESRSKTTFLTEFGRYRYRRAPMGLNSSGDEFCHRTDLALAHIPNVKKLVDDVLIFGPSEEDLLKTIRLVFEKCRQWNITLAEKKLQFGNQVKFAGFVLKESGTSPDPDKVAAIRDFPAPKDITNLRSWIGLVNQFTAYAPDLKQAQAPLQALLSTKNAYQWLPQHDMAMDKVKDILAGENSPILAHFDPKLYTTLLTDACKYGLGYSLVQHEHEDHSKAKQFKMITCGSRFLSPAERNYAVCELECLGIQWAVEKCRLYLLGAQFLILTDHKPLLGILNGRDLDSIQNTRLQRITTKLLGYSFKVQWIPGKKQVIADALSRAPVFQPEEEDQADVLIQAVKALEIDPALKIISDAAANDEEYQQVIAALAAGKHVLNLQKGHPGWMLKKQWDFLAFEDQYGLIVYHDRIFIPTEARPSILSKLHIQHTGQNKTYQNAKQLYFWPSMKNEIKQIVESCPKCVRMLPSQSAEEQIQTVTSRPMEAISVDLGQQNGDHFLIGADRYSGWPFVTKLHSLITKAITDALDEWFLEHGRPQRIRSDGGPQFRSEFKKWCKSRNIIHEQSSAYHHESNGHAEVAVRDMKSLLEKTESWKKFQPALLEWRNTPRQHDSLSPAQWFLGRRQKTDAAALPQAYERISDKTLYEAEILRGERREIIKERTASCSRSDLSVDQRVLIQHWRTKRWDLSAVVLEKRNKNRSYLVEAENGKRYLRNRKFLRPDTISMTEQSPETISMTEQSPEVNETSAEEIESKPKPILRRSERTTAKKKTVYFEKRRK